MTQREKVAVRLSPSDLEAIDQLAAEEQRTRSDMIRVLLTEALAAARARKRKTNSTTQALTEALLQNYPGHRFEWEHPDS